MLLVKLPAQLCPEMDNSDASADLSWLQNMALRLPEVALICCHFSKCVLLLLGSSLQCLSQLYTLTGHFVFKSLDYSQCKDEGKLKMTKSMSEMSDRPFCVSVSGKRNRFQLK